MQHIMKQIKTVTKKYSTKSGERESVSKRVDIGVTDLFEDGECVVVISKTNFDKLENDSTDIVAKLEKEIADKDAIIDSNNESIAKYKLEVNSKTDIIADLSKEIKVLKNTVAELEADVSAKDDKIDGLLSEVTAKTNELTESENTIDKLNAKLDELTPTVDELKELLLTKDSTISDLDKQIAVYDAIDISELKDKVKELDKSKNIIIRLQNEKTEYIQLVNYHKETATAYKNQKWYNKALGKDAAAEITVPTLYLIDESGNTIKDSNADKPDVDSSGDDDVRII